MFSLHGDHIQNLSPGVKSYRGNHMGESSLALPFPFERCICIMLLQQHYLNDNEKKSTVDLIFLICRTQTL